MALWPTRGVSSTKATMLGVLRVWLGVACLLATGAAGVQEVSGTVASEPQSLREAITAPSAESHYIAQHRATTACSGSAWHAVVQHGMQWFSIAAVLVGPG